MSQRRLYLDRAPGETRGVVTLGGRPERLFLERQDDDPDCLSLGRRYVARLARIERAVASAFLDLGGGREALLALSGEAKALNEGAAVEIEITAEARRGKLALARYLGSAQGAPRALAPAPSLIQRLSAFAPGVSFVEGAEAREVADEAEGQVLAVEHPLPGGGSLAIEPTRALVAVDVDLGARSGDVRRIARQANLTALTETARLLRLKGLAGLVAIDLVGSGHDGAALAAAAKTAFAPDDPGVALGPISRFGILQIAAPWRIRPLAERLCEASGAVSPATAALRLLRALEREGRADGGARLLATCAPAVAEAATPYIGALTDSIGPRFEIRTEPQRRIAHYEVSTR